MLNLIEAAFIVSIPFAIIMWLGIFLNTFKHFPGKNKKERLRFGILNATVTTVLIMGLVYLSMELILRNLSF